MFQVDGDEDLVDLAPPALAGIEKKGPGELHRKGRGALLLAAILEINVGGFEDPPVVEPPMVKEALVLGGGDCIDQGLGNVSEAHHAAFFAVRRKVGEQPRIELILFGRDAIAQ